MNKFLIILAYYDRPEIVLNALDSINKLDYDNFEVCFLDDGSQRKGEPIVREYCKEIIDKFEFIYIDNTPEQKKAQGGSLHGHYMNETIKNSDADIVVILCDDDALVSNYLSKLNDFYSHMEIVQSNLMWAYCHINYYNPSQENYLESNNQLPDFASNWATHNMWVSEINPVNKLDSSQITFRRRAYVDGNIWYPSPQTKSLDAAIFTQMYKKWGPCYFTNVVGQYKGWFKEQIGWVEGPLFEAKDYWEYKELE